ncbi:MAG TPA: dinitrogenase iron-molybdenum cofactor biosynthesis protein [Spirochaeta sp.]|nr:dinitrogenase iron-molybdenum cofactor biosynthesis protein [Spirochaeta sp.]
MRIIAAVATDDGKTTNNKHFGDADFYYIYEINEEGHRFIKSIDNSTDVENESHADPRKAKSVTAILSAEKVNTAVAKVFGPNLKRIRSKFVCILVKTSQIEEVLKKIQSEHAAVEAEWEKGSERSHLKLI